MKPARAYLLFAILPLAVLVGGFVLLSTTSARAYLEEHEARRYQTTAINEANATLAVAQARVAASTYDNLANDEIQDALTNGADVGLDNVEGNPLRVLLVDARSEVWISQLSDGWYQLDAVASIGGKRAHVRTHVRERDPFTRFSSFVNSHPIGIGGTPKGDIHANRVVQLFFQDGYYEDLVSARDGFEWLVGAAPGNTTFAGGYDDSHPEIPMPGIATIQQLSSYSDGALTALLGPNDPVDYDISVELKGTVYDIVAVKKSDGTALSALNLDFPSDGVLYFAADLASLHGVLDDRITVASTGAITITGSIRYIDSDGDPIYLNGLSTDPENEEYVPNPDYDGHAGLGVVANGDILYSHDIPDILEINGVFFSATGRYGLPGLTFTPDGRFATGYDATFQKNSYRRLGGILTDKRIVSTVVNGSGQVLSGFRHGKSVYDKRLRSSPPPHFLAIDRPVFGAYRVVSGGDAGTVTGEAGTFSLNGLPIGQLERDAGVTEGY